jgi:hypothetical protein
MKKFPIKVSGMLHVFKELEDELFDSIPSLLAMTSESRINMEDIGDIPAHITDYDDEDNNGVVKNKIITALYLDENKDMVAECSDGTTTANFSFEDMQYVMEYILQVVEEDNSNVA